MPRSPDFLLGFGFASRDKGLLKYLKDVKDGLSAIKEGFTEVEKAAKGVQVGKASATEGIQSFRQVVEGEVTRTGRYRRYSSFDDHRSFVERLKEAIDPDPKKILFARLERTLERLSDRYQKTGQRLNELKYFTEIYAEALRKAKIEERHAKIIESVQDFGVSLLQFMGIPPSVAKFLFKTLPKGLDVFWKSFKKTTVGVYKWFTHKRKGLPSFKQRLYNALFIRKKDARAITKSFAQVQQSAQNQIKKIDPIAAAEKRDAERIKKIKRAFDRLNIGGVLTEAVRTAMKKAKDIIKKADLPKSLSNVFLTARNRASTQLRLLEKRVRRATGRRGITGAFRTAATSIRRTLGTLGQDFRVFASDTSDQFESVVRNFREMTLSVRAEFDRMWDHLSTSGEKTFTSVIADKEKFSKKFVANFRDIAGKTETQLGRISTEARVQFSRMASHANRAFERMGEELERSITEAVRAAKRGMSAAESDIIGEVTRKGRKVREGKERTLVISGEEKSAEKMIGILKELVQIQKSIALAGAPTVGESDLVKVDGLDRIIQAIDTMRSDVVDKLSSVQSTIKASAVRPSIAPKAKGEGIDFGKILDLASTFIPQLRSLKIIRGFKK